MILKKLIIILILSSVTTVFADDLIVDKNSRSQYQTDNFLRFDPFDFNNQTPHNSGWVTPDTIDLSNKAVTLGSTFTQEVWIFSDQNGYNTQEVIGYSPSDDKIDHLPLGLTITVKVYGMDLVMVQIGTVKLLRMLFQRQAGIM